MKIYQIATTYTMWVVTLLVVVYLVLMVIDKYDDEMVTRGHAISNYLHVQLGVDVAPEDARYLDVNVNQYDIEVNDLTIFSEYGK